MSEPDVARTSRHLILSSKFETAGLAGLFGLEMANTAGSDDTHVDQDPQIICKWTRSRRLKRRVHNGWNRLPTGGVPLPPNTLLELRRDMARLRFVMLMVCRKLLDRIAVIGRVERRGRRMMA